MPAAVKYQKITSILKKRIAQGEYTDRLPSRRQLMQEFQVSSRTMHKVFTELKNMNCITPTFHGTAICSAASEVAQYPVRIVLVAPKISETLHTDILHIKLAEYIAEAGFELIPCDINRENIVDIIADNRLNSHDAVIFTYSSFQVKSAELLKKHNIPFVSANRPPEGVEINWVDWDHMEIFNDFVGNMLMRGARSLDIFWTKPQAGLSDNHTALMYDFRAVKRSYSLFNRDLDAFPESDWGNVEKYAAHLCSLKKLPDAVWVLDNSRRELADLLTAGGIANTDFLVTHVRNGSKETPVLFYTQQGYCNLAHKVWQLLCHVRRHSTAPPRGIKQQCDVKFYEYKYKQLTARMNKTI